MFGLAYAANAIRHKTLTSTTKYESIGEGGTDPCPWDTDGRKDCAATVNAEYNLIDETFDRLEASNASPPGCTFDLLLPKFSNITVHGLTLNPVRHSSFSKGIPRTVSVAKVILDALGYQTVDPAAITIGQTVYYSPDAIDLADPTWEQFKTITEEVAHVEQFLTMWANMPLVRDLVEIGNRGQTREVMRSPDYAQALIQWGRTYKAAVDNTPAGMDPYSDNSIEAPAKRRASEIVEYLRNAYAGRARACR